MSDVWFTSDLHLGHKNICKYRPEFSSPDEHSRTIIENIKGCVRKRDTLWVLGDSVFTEEWLEPLDKITCTKILVAGNHCAQHFDNKKLYAIFDRVYGIRKKYGAWLSHAPIHPDELRGSFCVHGHTHRHHIDDRRYINLCIENHNFMPRDLKWLRSEMEDRNCGQ